MPAHRSLESCATVALSLVVAAGVALMPSVAMAGGRRPPARGPVRRLHPRAARLGLDAARALGSAVGSTGAWPSDAVIWRAEAALRRYLTGHPLSVARWIGENLHLYGRQWVGVVVGGRRMLYANCFLFSDVSTDRFDWRHEALFVCDGGDAYFQLLFDVESGRCGRLVFNGEA